MNSLKTFIIVSLLIFGTGSVQAENVIHWVNPDKFSDVSFSNFPRERDRKVILADLERYFQDRLDYKFKDGVSMEVSVTNVDLAGEYEPWRAPQLNQVRIVKTIYPARLDLDYKLTNANGEVIAEGSERLRENYQTLPHFLRNDNHPYVKDLFNRWVKSFKIPSESSRTTN